MVPLDIIAYEWTVPGKPFADYNPEAPLTNPPSQLNTTLDKKQQSLSFYWADSGTAHTVQCRIATLDGKLVTLTASLSVEKPVVIRFDGSPGDLKVNVEEPFLWLGPPRSGRGIVWLAFVEMPPGLEGRSGECCFVQLWTPDRTAKRGTQDYHWPAVVVKGLDKGFPYVQANRLPTFPVDVAGDSGDGPYQALVEGKLDGTEVTMLPYDSVKVNDRFQTWLMFRPDGADSKWVPLRVFEWSFQAGTSYDPALKKHSLQPGALGPAPTQSVDTTEHPQWPVVYQGGTGLIPGRRAGK